jgi:hypothetical protein
LLIKKVFVNKGILTPITTAQKQKCETAGGTATDSLGYVIAAVGSTITGSCTATPTNTVTESGGGEVTGSINKDKQDGAEKKENTIECNSNSSFTLLLLYPFVC